MNKSTGIFVTAMGILIGMGGLGHAVAEMLQGNKPAADIAHKIGAFTVIDNYLYTGICAALLSILIIIWSIGYIYKKRGALFFLIFSIVLIFVGGGVAQIVGILLTFLMATRINKSLNFWKHILSDKIEFLSKLWMPAILTGYGLLLTGIAIWILFLPPGKVRIISNIHYLCWSSLVVGLIFLLFAIVFGFARDIKINKSM